MGEYTSKFPDNCGGIFLLGYFGKIFVTFPTCCSGKSAAYKTNSWLSECLRRESFFAGKSSTTGIKNVAPHQGSQLFGKSFWIPKMGCGKSF